MKILITGVAGFLGSHLADRLIELGHSVVGVDNLVGGNINNVNENVEFRVCDCLDMTEMINACSGCDMVFHAACTAHDGFSLFSPNYITKNTFQNTVSVLSAAAKSGVKKFVYCSSMSRYGKQNQTPFTEDMLCNPQVPYGVAKYAAELVVKQICLLNDMEYCIVVPHNIIGPRQCYIDPYRNVAAIMINRMLQNKQPIIYGDGLQKRCFSYVSDVVFCLEQALFQNDVNGEIINVGPDEEFITINELASKIATILDFDLNPIYYPKRPNEVKFATCSADKARKLLNYTTTVGLSEGLEKMIEYIKKEGPKDFIYNYEIEIISKNIPHTWLKQEM